MRVRNRGVNIVGIVASLVIVYFIIDSVLQWYKLILVDACATCGEVHNMYVAFEFQCSLLNPTPDDADYYLYEYLYQYLEDSVLTIYSM